MGFGDQRTGVYTKTKKLTSTPWGAFGRFVSANDTEITVKSPARFGDSGGPLFIKTTRGEALLIGVIKSTSILKKSNNPLDDEYTGTTKAIPLSHVYSILQSKKMKCQIESGRAIIQKIYDTYSEPLQS